jgi:hypothetical protein
VKRVDSSFVKKEKVVLAPDPFGLIAHQSSIYGTVASVKHLLMGIVRFFFL